MTAAPVSTPEIRPTLAVLACWAVVQRQNDFYISGLRADYLTHFCRLCTHVYLIAPTTSVDAESDHDHLQRLSLPNLTIVPLPPLPVHGAHVAALRHGFSYYRQIRQTKPRVTHFYCQTPDPFCWLPTLLRCPKVTMHHVGSSVETTWRSSRPLVTRALLVALFVPEFIATWLASRRSRVVCNGQEISRRLGSYGIRHKAVISSTVNACDLQERTILEDDGNHAVRLLYVGYLRPAKGLRSVIAAAALLKQRGCPFRLRLVGDGEERADLLALVKHHALETDVQFLGHVDSRQALRKIYNSSDMFVFMSSSEGSPRVVVEAMASSLLVISTRVGSLPSVFAHGQELVFVDDSAESLANAIIDRASQPAQSAAIARRAFLKVKRELMQAEFIRHLVDD